MTLGRTHKLRVYHHLIRAHLSFKSKDSICSSDGDMLGLMKTREESNPLLANIDVASLPFVDARVKVYPFVD